MSLFMLVHPYFVATRIKAASFQFDIDLYTKRLCHSIGVDAEQHNLRHGFEVLVGRSVGRLDLQSVARRVHDVDSSNLSDGFKRES
mgnify:CR=1 FL=1